VILIILDVIPIVNFMVMGYFAKCIKESPTSKSPPQLANFGDLWIQGAKIFVVSLVYLIIPIALIVPLVIAATAFGSVLGWVGFGALTLTAGIILGVVGLILLFLLTLIMVMAIVNMVKKNSMSKAFAIGEILEIIRRISWGNYIVWAIVIFIIGVVVGLIGLIPYVGWLFSLILAPVLGVFIARSIALVYSEGVPEIVAPPAEEKAPEQAPTITEAKETKYCIHCGARIPADSAFCPKCGGQQ
jgi:ribosomal protein L40E